jgi:hypothetical protein
MAVTDHMREVGVVTLLGALILSGATVFSLPEPAFADSCDSAQGNIASDGHLTHAFGSKGRLNTPNRDLALSCSQTVLGGRCVGYYWRLR